MFLFLLHALISRAKGSCFTKECIHLTTNQSSNKQLRWISQDWRRRIWSSLQGIRWTI